MGINERTTIIDIRSSKFEDILTMYPAESLKLLFRGVRNDDSPSGGNWWSEDAYYALGCTNDDRLYVTAVPVGLIAELQETNQLTNESDHEGNKWQFRRFNLPHRQVNDDELTQLLSQARITKLGATRAIKTRFGTQARIDFSRDVILK